VDSCRCEHGRWAYPPTSCAKLKGCCTDRTHFNASTNYSTAFYNSPSFLRPYPEATNLTVGPDYYSLVSHLPANTHVVFGVNLGSNDTENALNMARSIVNAFDSTETKDKNISLTFLEVGNEGDLYNGNGLRPKNYTASEWIQDWTAVATNLSAELNLTERSTRFWGPSFAESTHGGGFSPPGVFDLGLRTTPAGQLLSTVSQHHYSGTFCFGGRSILQDLILKANIHGNISAFGPDIAAAKKEGLDFYFGETNSISCHGAPGVSDAAAAALWFVDYSLYAATLGVKRMFYHEGVGYKYNLIQPVPLDRDIQHGTKLPQPMPPHVQPQYYGAIIVAQATGSSGNASVVELKVGHVFVSGYAVYEGDTLKRAVFVHGRAWTSGDEQRGRARPSTQIFLSGLPSSLSSSAVKVRRLSVSHSDDTYPAANVTWAGQGYNTTDGRVSGDEVVETRKLADGIDLGASEIVLVEFS
jgi:hypothetical protein